METCLIESQHRLFYHLVNSKGQVISQGQRPAKSFMILTVIGLKQSESLRSIITREIEHNVWTPGT